MNKSKYSLWKWLLLGLVLGFLIPLTSVASTGQSGLIVAKYKIEGAQSKGWTNLPISSTSHSNSYNISITEPGLSTVTLYAEDRAGNQNYQIKTFSIIEGVEDAPVAKIEYRLRGATSKGWTTYSSPFVISNEGVTHVDARITDQAGNVNQFSQDIKLDKTQPVNVEAVISLE